MAGSSLQWTITTLNKYTFSIGIADFGNYANCGSFPEAGTTVRGRSTLQQIAIKPTRMQGLYTCVFGLNIYRVYPLILFYQVSRT